MPFLLWSRLPCTENLNQNKSLICRCWAVLCLIHEKNHYDGKETSQNPFIHRSSPPCALLPAVDPNSRLTHSCISVFLTFLEPRCVHVTHPWTMEHKQNLCMELLGNATDYPLSAFPPEGRPTSQRRWEASAAGGRHHFFFFLTKEKSVCHLTFWHLWLLSLMAIYNPRWGVWPSAMGVSRAGPWLSLLPHAYH